MKHLLIERFTTHRDLGTLSMASFPSIPSTNAKFPYLEPPWANNEPYKSCVPPGVYTGIWDNSPKYGDVYFLLGGTVVQNSYDLSHGATRFACIAGHGANWHYQLQGCGAFGMAKIENHIGRPGSNRRSHMITSSKKALGKVHDILERDPIIQITIAWAAP